MSDWASAIASGLGAAANTGAQIIGDQMKQQQAIDAEQRAADIKLDLAQRMAAADEMMKNRAAERFSTTVKQKAGEDVPMEAPSVAQTGVTRDSAHALGLPDGIAGDSGKIQGLMRQAQAVLSSPGTTAEQKADAQGLLDQLNKQVGAQGDINAKAVDGKTRKRTFDEANQAALEDAMQNDAPAFVAGTGMLANYGKLDDGDKKLKLQQSEADRKERMANADRDSRERVAAERDDTRERIASQRMEAMFERLNGGKNSNKSAMVQNLEWLRDNLKMTDAQLMDYVTEKKRLAPEDIAAKLLSADKFGDLTPETAMQRAMGLVQARDKMQGGAAPSAGAPAPKRLKYNPATGKVE